MDQSTRPRLYLVKDALELSKTFETHASFEYD